MDTEARLKQIEKIAQNARTTWFGLLALLVFVGVTLMGHKDSAFFAYGAATKLPIVGIEVPPTAFFIAAPILTASLYCYLHIYLLGLWDALADIEQEPDAPPLADRIWPMLFTLLALWYRSISRKDGSMPPRVLGALTFGITYILGWGFGIVILIWLWWRSMPAHDPWITLLAGGCLWAGLYVEIRSRYALALRMSGMPRDEAVARVEASWRTGIFWLVVIVLVSWQRAGGITPLTHSNGGLPIWMARADLAEANLTAKPKDWLDYEDWQKEAAYKFRSREDLPADAAQWTDEKSAELEDELQRRWVSLTGSLNKVSLKGRDLRGADLHAAFLIGADLREALLTGADMANVSLEGANLSFAKVERTFLRWSRLEGAQLTWLGAEGADLAAASMDGADLRWARLSGADLERTRMAKAKLGWADLTAALLLDTDLRGANCSEAIFEGALVRGADLRCAPGTLEQDQLTYVVGDSFTLLHQPLTLWSCLEKEALPAEVLTRIEAGIAQQPARLSEPKAAFGGVSREEFRQRLFCEAGEEPVEVGRWIEDE